MEIKCQKVFDIKNCSVNEIASYYLDTNIWYWLTYPRVTFKKDEERQKAIAYTKFIADLQANKSEFYSTVFTYSELINIVERNEFSINQKLNTYPNKKAFRQNVTSRKETVEIIANVLEQVDEFSTSKKLPQVFNDLKTNVLIEKMKSSTLDGNDLLVGILVKKNGITDIISDDIDFASLEGINLYTLNTKVLEAAKEQGILQ